MITPVYNRTSSDSKMTATDMNRICANVNELTGASLRTDWTTDDIVDADTWYTICFLAQAIGLYDVTYDVDFVNVNNIEHALYDYYEATKDITERPALTSLEISNGTLSPGFSSTTYSYTATVEDLTSVISATSAYSSIGYIVNGEYADPNDIEWKVGTNTLQVTATLNGSTVTYTVTVTCTYDEAELLTLSIGGESITVDTQMMFETDNATDELAYTANGDVTVTLNGEEVTGATLTWMEDSNVLVFTVEADDTKTYTALVTCAYEAAIPGLIDGLTISDSVLLPAFSPTTYTYTVYPDGDTSTVTVVLGDVDATISFNGTAIENGDEVEWDTDDYDDVITVVTTAEDGYTSVTYTITSAATITTSDLAPLRSGEIIAGGTLIPGEAGS